MARLRTVLQLAAPPPFDFRGTAYSHGWVVLAPNSWDNERSTLRRVDRLASGRVVLLEISGAGTAEKPRIQISVEHHGRLSATDGADIGKRVGHMFRIDEDLGDFYAICQSRGEHWVNVTAGRGRLLRSPGLFEDVVKIICTTNTQWGGTKRMVAALVDAYGEPYRGDATRKAFPTPQAVAAADAEEFAARVRMGYRAPYVHQLARRIAAGALDLSTLNGQVSTSELTKRLLDIKGIGNYAAATLLMLLGRYDRIAVDSVCREFVKKKYFNGRVPTDAEIHGIYESWGEWRYLAYWCDIWHSFHGAL
jgi:3-methyladenine DNA glycosylase/8-oxoguanine DNA glycosylase